jgi:bifunctional pyridoxal-dependent enzyme with beta-cystathionase and maltose regulon repressor activities
MDGSLAKAIKKALTACIKKGYVDKPQRGHIRAVLTDAREYQPDEWEFCLLESLGKELVTRDDAVKKAVTWAAENLGLTQKSVRKTSPVYKKLKLAITATIRTREVKAEKQKYIRLAK